LVLRLVLKSVLRSVLKSVLRSVRSSVVWLFLLVPRSYPEEVRRRQQGIR